MMRIEVFGNHELYIKLFVCYYVHDVSEDDPRILLRMV